MGGADRTAEHSGDELGEDLVWQGLRVSGALEGETVEGGSDCCCESWRRKAELEAQLLGNPLQGVGESVADSVAALGELVLELWRCEH